MTACGGLSSYLSDAYKGKGMLSALNADAVLCVVLSPIETAYALPAMIIVSL